MSEEQTGARQGILALTIKDKNALYAAYMPTIKNGGLFIPTTRSYRLGDEVFMLLQLMDEPERIPISGRVVWITPKGAAGFRSAGIGVQFSDEDGGVTKALIESYLSGYLESDQPTHTM
ncbi:PilZ domain-containing protein [Methylococcus capsulatus]|uniref:PilZ domain-containing protein n=1 Tax=Methylococcus capsulatus TaxID=414 RepID=UPI002FDB4E02